MISSTKENNHGRFWIIGCSFARRQGKSKAFNRGRAKRSGQSRRVSSVDKSSDTEGEPRRAFEHRKYVIDCAVLDDPDKTRVLSKRIHSRGHWMFLAAVIGIGKEANGRWR